jgi:multidrug efflux pump subunit AcrB
VKTALLVFLFAIVLVVIGPLLLLWALNTLFPALAIPYTLWTWCAAFLLSAPFVNRGKN